MYAGGAEGIWCKSEDEGLPLYPVPPPPLCTVVRWEIEEGDCVLTCILLSQQIAQSGAFTHCILTKEEGGALVSHPLPSFFTDVTSPF